MKLLNLGIDDLYMLSNHVHAVTPSGIKADLLSLCLGDPIYKGICNHINFGGDQGWNLSDDSELAQNRFGMRLGFGLPTIWDEGDKGKGSNLLFTGVYASDCLHLAASLSLRYRESYLMNKVKVVAGGYKALDEGRTWVNLVLVVPNEMEYVIDNTVYSCKTGKPVANTLGRTITMDDVFRNSVVS